MGLFRRNTNVEPEPEKCPLCGERVPDGADECRMCGANLKPLRPSAGAA
jgi:ribosomal protein L40E